MSYSLEDARSDRRQVEKYDAAGNYEDAHGTEDYMHMEFIRDIAAGKYVADDAARAAVRIAEEMVALAEADPDRVRWYA